MIDLLPLKDKIVAVPKGEMRTILEVLSAKVVKLVKEELGAEDFKGIKRLSTRFVYVTQRDEYNKPRAGGLQNIAIVEMDLEGGKPTRTAVDVY